MGLLDWLRGGGEEKERHGAGSDVRVGTPEEQVGVDPRAQGDAQEERVRIGTPEEAAEDTYHGPIETDAEDRHQEERARHSGI